jgi:hypothetical protein
MKPARMRKLLQETEAEITKDIIKHCGDKGILWTRKHTELLKSALGEYLTKGLWPIIEDFIKPEDESQKKV